MTEIVNLKPESKFMYSGRMYQILAEDPREHPRFRIQEKVFADDVPRYSYITDRIFVFCFDTGQLGSFSKDTAVRPVYTVKLPIPLGETPLTNPSDPTKALLIKMWDAQVKILDAKLLLKNAEAAYAETRIEAFEACKNERFTGVFVRGCTIIEVHSQCIKVTNAEILE